MGGRLPTEAEWEYAARGPRATIYPWGDDLDGTRLNSCDVNMAGNVWEWVADWHGPYPFTRQTNPTGPERGSKRLIRGGSWYENDDYRFLRADNRHLFDPRDYNHLIGFRCVVPVKRVVIE